MINLTPSDAGKLARLSNGLVVGPLNRLANYDGAIWFPTQPCEGMCWKQDGSSLSGGNSIVEVLDMPTKKLTITKDDVGRWVKLRNGWIVGPIKEVSDGKAYIEAFGSFVLSGVWCHGVRSTLDIIAIIDPPDQEDHA